MYLFLFFRLQLDKIQKKISAGETKAASADSTSELGSVRRIDAGLVDFKHVLMAVLILLISGAVYVCQSQNHSL